MQRKDATLAALVAEMDGVFTVEHAKECGLTEDQIEYRAAHVWQRLYPTVFRWPGSPITWRSQLRAASYGGEPHAVLSHRTAARLRGLPGGHELPVELSCPRWRRSQTSGLLVHETTLVHPNDVELIDGLPVTTAERTVIDLASIYRSADFIEMVLHAARRKRLITYASTKATFDRLAGRGRPGVVVFREALQRWPGTKSTESDQETLLLQVLRQNGLPKPVLQYDVFDESGRFVARADAAYPQWRVLIEYDSKQEHSDEWALARDASRRNRLLALGHTTLTARHRDLKSGGGEFCTALRACRRRAESEPA
jgi:hypothetical protein